MKEKVLEAFSELGFKLEPMDDIGYGFRYEGTNYLYMPIENDNDFLNIAVPGIYSLDETGEQTLNELIAKINTSIKYVKSYLWGDSVWLFYERELLEGEDLKEIISRMILHLEAALSFARQIMVSIEDKSESIAEEIVERNDNESTETND